MNTEGWRKIKSVREMSNKIAFHEKALQKNYETLHNTKEMKKYENKETMQIGYEFYYQKFKEKGFLDETDLQFANSQNKFFLIGFNKAKREHDAAVYQYTLGYEYGVNGTDISTAPTISQNNKEFLAGYKDGINYTKSKKQSK